MKKVIFALLLASFSNAGGLYNSSFFNRSGILHQSINTGIPNYIDGSRLLHWHGYISSTIHIVFDGDEFSDDEELDRLASLIANNRDRIRYISILGYSSSIVDNENRVALRDWASIWHSIGGEHRLEQDRAIALVNSRLHRVYDFLIAQGVSANKIYNENRLDREPITTEATSIGRLHNNRVDVRIYSSKPLLKANNYKLK